MNSEFLEIFQRGNLAPIDITSLFANLLIGVLFSFAISWHFRNYGSTLSNREELNKVFPLILLTTILIITVVKSSIALSLGLVGALSIVRFRTPIRTPYELVHYFSLLTIGISAKVDLSITIILIIILSVLPYFIKRFSLIGKNSLSENEGKLLLNFQGLMKENELDKIVNDKNIKNYSVKREGDSLNISGSAVFSDPKEKEKFLNEWSSKINSYNVDLDENN